MGLIPPNSLKDARTPSDAAPVGSNVIPDIYAWDGAIQLETSDSMEWQQQLQQQDDHHQLQLTVFPSPNRSKFWRRFLIVLSMIIMVTAMFLGLWFSGVIVLDVGARPIESCHDNVFVNNGGARPTARPTEMENADVILIPDGGATPIDLDDADVPVIVPDARERPIEQVDQVIELSCPQIGDPPSVIGHPDDYDRTRFRLGIFQGEDVLCTLVEATWDEGENPAITTTAAFTNLKPVGRSYNGNDWEAAPGDFSRLVFDCNGDCAVQLPRPPEGRVYVLRSSDYGHQLRPDDLVARFLERATFGPTKADIQNFTSPEDWVG